MKENLRNICLYVGFMGIFYVVLELYNVRNDAVNYAFLLSAFWLFLYESAELVKYICRHRALLEAGRRIPETDEIPAPAGVIEEDYQNMIKTLCEERFEIETKNRISRQEMEDYYQLWAHQIKTPVSVLRLLLQTFEESGEEQAHALIQDMKLETFKIEQYVEMALTYLRMESMASDLRLEVYALDDMIRKVVRKYSHMFILRKIKLVYEPVNRKALTDEKWLAFVLEQVLSNALKYTADSGSVFIYMKEDFLVIEDTGIGIYAEDLPRVFEKGFTGYNGRSDKKSTGIGLYLCKTIMDKLESEFFIESEPGKGTKVYIGLNRQKLRVE